MGRLGIGTLAAVSVFALTGCSSGHNTAGRSNHAHKQAASPCGDVTGVAVWSPNGDRIAYVGARRPIPYIGSGVSPLQAICVADGNGRHAKPLRYTVCRTPCRLDLIDSPSQLAWVRPKLLLYLDSFRIFKVPLGQRPEPLGKQDGIDTFSVDAGGDRIALGSSVCALCHGPVTVESVKQGSVLGTIGGPAADNFGPSLSPGGKRLAFVKTVPTHGVWTASATGGDLRPLRHCDFEPLWSPTGAKIACLVAARPRFSALVLVSPQGGASTTLVSRGVQDVFGWSPNGNRIAFLYGRRCGCRLEVVDVRTGKMRQLMGGAASVAWSPNSRQLLVTEPSEAFPGCTPLWRVPADGGKPRLLRKCS
jgi:Tol biopolymer transport system component